MGDCGFANAKSVRCLGLVAVVVLAPWAWADVYPQQTVDTLQTSSSNINEAYTARSVQRPEALAGEQPSFEGRSAPEGVEPGASRRWSKEQLQQLRDEIRTTSRNYPSVIPTD